MQNDTKLTLDQLVPGDVLVMVGDLRPSNPTRYLDELIMLLTNSDACHGAIFVGQDPTVGYQLIDDALNGVGLRKIRDNDNPSDPRYGRWYVRRMDKPSLEPVISAAEQYVGRSVYDKVWLVMLGVLLAIKDILPSDELERMIIKLLKHILYVIDQYFHKPGTDYFVCSQYVATAFSDAGSEFQLRYKAGGLTSGANPLDALMREFASVEAVALGGGELGEIVPYINQNTSLQLTDLMMTNVDEQLLNNAAKLVVTLIQRADDRTRAALLSQAGGYQNAFVTPACLKDGCTNLNAEGLITLGYGE